MRTGAVSTWGSFLLACALLAGFTVGMLPAGIMVLVVLFILAAVWFAL